MVDGPSGPPPEEDVNYLLEMFKHPGNFWGLCAGLIAGSAAAVATGIAPAILIPVVAQAGLNGLMALFVPESPVFREAVDRKKRKTRRESVRAHLVEEIERRVPGSHDNWAAYHRMREQLSSLQKTAKATESTLSLWDVERLDETSVDFLWLWLARISIHERMAATNDRSIASQIKQLEHQLGDESLGFMDKQRLGKARDDLQTVLDRRRSYTAHDQAMAANMVAMADAFGAVYHRIMANPSGQDVGNYLDDALARMSATEELDFAADLEIDRALAKSKAARSAASQSHEAMREAQPARQRKRQKGKN
jgi:hypothetical protein